MGDICVRGEKKRGRLRWKVLTHIIEIKKSIVDGECTKKEPGGLGQVTAGRGGSA